MKQYSSEKGSSLIVILAIIFILNSLLFLSLKRSESAFQLVRNRYLGSVVRDMAENGIVFERLMISKGQGTGSDLPHQKEIGIFASCAGSFESFRKPLKQKNTYEIVSHGILLDRKGKAAFSAHITARVLLRADGQWETIHWSEQSS